MEFCDLLEESVLSIVVIPGSQYLSVHNPFGFSFGGFTFPSHACSDCWHPRNVKGNRLYWIWQQGDRLAFQQFSRSCDDKHASSPPTTLALVVRRRESHVHYIGNIQTTRCRICYKTPSGARLLLLQRLAVIRALMDVPEREEAGGTPQLRHILFAGRGTELEAEGAKNGGGRIGSNTKEKKDFDMGADTDRRRRLGREKYK